METKALTTEEFVARNGRPVENKVHHGDGPDPIFGFFAGKGIIIGDITEPLFTEAAYEGFFEAEAAKYSSAPVVAKR